MEALLSRLQKITRKLFRLDPRHRIGFVLFGSLAILASWPLPWYAPIVWLTPAGEKGLETGDGHLFDTIGELSADPAIIAKYGQYNAVQGYFSGHTLTYGGALTQDFGLRPSVWQHLAIAVVFALLAIAVSNWKSTNPVVRVIRFVLNWAAGVAVLSAVAIAAFRARDRVSFDNITAMTRGYIIQEGGKADWILHIEVGLSWGYLSLLLGLLLLAVGVLAGTRTEAELETEAGAAKAVRLALGLGTAAFLVFIGIVMALWFGWL